MSLKFEPPKNNIIFTNSDKRKKSKRNKIIFNSTIFLIICGLIFFSIKFISAWKKQNDSLKKSEIIYDNINDRVEENETATLPPDISTEENETQSPITIYQKMNFDKLLEINSEAYGWLEVTGLDISYPVAKAHDNDYYIGNSFNKEPSINGSVFRDYRCTDNSDITILYGHRSADGSMFYPLDLLDSSYSNNKIVITREKTYIYDIWAVAHVPSAGDAYRINFSDSWSFANYVDYIKSYAVNTTSHINNISDASTLLMLSTCISTSKHPYRRVVCAYLTQVIE